MNNQGQNVNIRELVLNVLIEVLEKNQYSSQVIHNTLRTYQYLDKKDRSFFQRLSEGSIERMIELDYIINTYSKVKVNKMKPVIRNILRMAVYQIQYMEQVPESAACNEAVKLAVKKGFHSLKAFVNAVLRNIIRGKNTFVYPSIEENPNEYFSVRYSMPIWLVEKWRNEFSDLVIEKMLSSFYREGNTTIRCNQNKISTKEMKQRLLEQNIVVKEGEYIPYALHIEQYNYLEKISGFLEGYFQVQDESSMLVAEVAGVKKNDYIIDVCSAPGGKSTHLAEKLEGTGIVIARDLSEYKIHLIEENKKRLGIENLKVELQDALELVKEDIEKADLVIADLPCSGLGIIGKKTDIKYKITQESISSLIQLQREILSIIWQYVKSGGTLIYSTCTINPKENIENIKWFMERFPFTLESLEPFLPEKVVDLVSQKHTISEGYLQILPGMDKMDGFFVARLRRK